MRKNTIFAVLTVLAVASFSYAAVDPNDIVWFDLDGWTGLNDGQSQTFEDVCGEDDLTVTAIGIFGIVNEWNGSYIVSGHALANQSHSFRFDYSGSEQLILETLTLDDEELVRVYFPGAENWQLVSGSVPTVTPVSGNGTQFQGIATGFGDPGVSNFLVYADGPVNTVTWTHESLDNFKYEFVRIGKVVPEPSSSALLGLSLLGLVGMIRRK